MSGRRILVSAIELAGHALPAIALARELGARGHDVVVQTTGRWRELLDELGLAAAPPHPYFGRPGSAGGAAEQATLADHVRGLMPAIRELGPDVVVSDGLTAAPALAAEVAGLPGASLLPEVYPVHERGLPLFGSGLVAPRTALGGAAWSGVLPLWRRLPGTRSARRIFNEQRRQLGLAPESGFHGSLSKQLTMVATFPQLEYPRVWPRHVHVTGPMMLDPGGTEVELPGGDDPLVVVASSTVKDMERRLVKVTLEALAEEPVRVLVTMGGGGEPLGGPVPANARVVDWISYPRVMPVAAAVVCNGNHGTIASALAHGVPVLVSPAMPDDAEHGARASWAGCGVMVPAWLLRPGPVRLAIRHLLDEERFGARAREIADWSRGHEGTARGAELVEELAGR